jgi:predicted amidohydrolase YtcJ
VLIHVNQASAEQLRRMRDLGVVATCTPGFLALAGDRYGLDRLGEAGVPLRALLDAGVPVALGTDGVPYAMAWTMWEALARRDEDAHRQLGDSRLTREEALRLAVQTGHLLTWSEERLGSLEVGKQADLVVVGEDPLTCPEERLRDLRIDMTLVGGQDA